MSSRFGTLSGKGLVIGHGVPQTFPITLDPSPFEGAVVYADNGELRYSDGSQWLPLGTGPQGTTGYQGTQGNVGVQGGYGPGFTIIGSVPDVDSGGDPQATLNAAFPSANIGEGVIDDADDELWIYDGTNWVNIGSFRGVQGFQGVQGNQGVQGTIGNEGIQGERGFRGFQGERGVQGFQGVQGEQGIQGIQGRRGPQGVQGITGIQGFTGQQGIQGVQGPQAFQGVQGTDGIQGIQGRSGSYGGVSFEYDFDASLVVADPTQSKFRFNNALASSATKVAIDAIAKNLGDISEIFDSIDDVEGPIKGYLQITQINDIQKFITFEITQIANQSGWIELDVNYLTATTTVGLLTSDPACIVSLTRVGDRGVQGIQGITGIQGFTGIQGIQGLQGVQGAIGEEGFTGGLTYAFNYATSKTGDSDDPGLGNFYPSTDNWGLGPFTLAIDALSAVYESNSWGIGSILDQILARTETVKGYLLLRQRADAASEHKISYLKITGGSNEGPNAWYLLNVEREHGVVNWTSGSPSEIDDNGDLFEVSFIYAGEKGEVGAQGITGPQGIQGLIGPQGVQGLQGSVGDFGGITYDYDYDNNTTLADPGPGTIRFDNVNLSTTDVKLLIDDVDDNGITVMDGVGAELLAVTGSVKGYVRIIDATDLTIQALFKIEGLIDRNGYWELTCNHVNGTTVLANGSDIRVSFVRNGDLGIQGLQGVQGVQGNFGPQGLQGVQGNFGPQGLQGNQGLQGDFGPQGVQGTTGIQGDTGLQGSEGATGIQGTQGAQGTTGIQGDTGIQGIQGHHGQYGGLTWIWNFSNNTIGGTDPGTNNFKFNNTNPQNATLITLDDVPFDQYDQEIDGFLDFIDSQPGTVKGYLKIQEGNYDEGSGPAGHHWLVYEITNWTWDGVGKTYGYFDVTFVDGNVTNWNTSIAVPHGPETLITFIPRGPAGIQGAQGTTGIQGLQGRTGAGIQGPQGPQGTDGLQGTEGSFGGITFDYTWKAETINNDPTPGYLKLNNATYASATALYIDDRDDNFIDIQPFLRTIDDSTSTIKGHFKITKKSQPEVFQIFTIAALTELTGYFNVTCAFVSGNGTFTDQDDITITFARTGDIGTQGDPGPQGVQGITGLQGFQGLQGRTGAGVQGADGAPGPQGFQGAEGADGLLGPQGIQGLQGADGVQGAGGFQGPGGSGAQGVQGIQGITGSQGIGGTGSDGFQGTQGIQGLQGTDGAQGLQGGSGGDGQPGPAGPQGAFGPQGIQGTQGPAAPGAQGLLGIQGLQGLQGNQGIQGNFGPQGAGGTGPQGVQGFIGPQGIGGDGNQGTQGLQGNQGIQGGPGVGSPGIQGPQGIQGFQGPAGDEGDGGVQGPAGPQGSDGLQGSSGSGLQGIQGPFGPQGFQGLAGSGGGDGPQGPRGFQGGFGPQGEAGDSGGAGIQGPAGPQGDQGPGGLGPQGIQGPQGQAGSGGTGPQGTQGITGEPGPGGGEGTQGLTGAQGATGANGVVGDTGLQGVQGPQGYRGIQGFIGLTGAQGTDGTIGPQGPAGSGNATAIATNTIHGSSLDSTPMFITFVQDSSTARPLYATTSPNPGGQSNFFYTNNIDELQLENITIQGSATLGGSTITSWPTGGGGSQNLFDKIAVTGQTTIAADNTADTLTFVAGSNMTITTDATTDSVTFTSSGGGGTQNLFDKVAVSGQTTIAADTATDTLTLVAGTNVTITTDATTDSVTINASGGGGGISDVVSDTTPQLGGNLDLNGNDITGTGDINITGTIDSTGTITTGGDFNTTSDERVKENIETIPNALDKVLALRGVNFNRIGQDERKVGLIAQEVEAILPEVVNTGDDGIKTVSYANIVGLLIEAIKDQQEEIEKLKK